MPNKPDKPEPTIYFSRPARCSNASPWFGDQVMRENKHKGIRTQLILDANILRAMDDDVVQKLENSCSNLEYLIRSCGLAPLVDIFHMVEHHNLPIEITPGAALSEYTPALKYQRRQAFEKFLHIISPGKYVDAPNSTATPKSGDTKQPEFRDLAPDRRSVLAISYYSLLLIQIIHERHRALTPEDRLHLYLVRTAKQIGVVSALELEIAKVCFCNRQRGYSAEFNVFATDIKENFLQPNGRITQRRHNILNGARDIYYLRFAGLMLDVELVKHNLDPWLVTMDRKLYRTAEAFHQVVLPNGTRTPLLAIDRAEELHRHGYWQNADRLSDTMLSKRMKAGLATKKMSDSNVYDLVCKLEEAIDVMDKAFQSLVIALP